jgi:hypothetical protein
MLVHLKSCYKQNLSYKLGTSTMETEFSEFEGLMTTGDIYNCVDRHCCMFHNHEYSGWDGSWIGDYVIESNNLGDGIVDGCKWGFKTPEYLQDFTALRKD